MGSHSSDETLKQELEELQKQLSKKVKFEESVRKIHALLRDQYPSASPSLRKQFYSVICRVATVLKTRYTSPGFWLAGLRLFEDAEQLVSDASEKEHLRSCIAQARGQLHQADVPTAETRSLQNRGYLFEGHMTVDPEPPQPQWLVQQNVINAFASLVPGESSRSPVEDGEISEAAGNLMQELMNSLENFIPEVLDMNAAPRRPPPASKEVVAKLPVITLTEETLAKLGSDAECCICKENLVVGDTMQELPCKHTFHPPCVKPWLDEHNSCPICRHELPTDDHKYESWKEREKEAEEERKGAANAVRGGEYMYV